MIFENVMTMINKGTKFLLFLFILLVAIVHFLHKIFSMQP